MRKEIRIRIEPSVCVTLARKAKAVKHRRYSFNSFNSAYLGRETVYLLDVSSLLREFSPHRRLKTSL
jgi:hypothetical protein